MGRGNSVSDLRLAAARHFDWDGLNCGMIETAHSQAKRIWTEAELQALPDDGYLHEVVDGELIMSPKNNFQHENICGRLYFSIASGWCSAPAPAAG